MKKIPLSVALMGLTVGILSGGDASAGKRIRFSLGTSGLFVKPDTGDTRGLFGPAAAVYFNLGRSLSIAPELTVGIGGVYAGTTVNLRFRKVFVGAGGGLLYFYSENQDIQGDGMFKVQIGTMGSDWMFAAAFVSNVFSGAWLSGAQVTVGYVF